MAILKLTAPSNRYGFPQQLYMYIRRNKVIQVWHVTGSGCLIPCIKTPNYIGITIGDTVTLLIVGKHTRQIVAIPVQIAITEAEYQRLIAENTKIDT